MGGDGLLSAVRRQLGLGRLLPLWHDGAWGAWLTERAARAALVAAVAVAVPGARLDALRLGLAGEPSGASSEEPSGQSTADGVPAPPGALPAGPLRVTAEIAAFPTLPLTDLAERVRATLAEVATERLGLPVAAVDVAVTELLAEPPEPAGPGREPPSPPDALGSGGPGADAVAEAVTAVDGVGGLSAVLDGWLGAVRVEDRDDPPSRLVRLQLAVVGLGAGRPLPALVAEVARVATATAATAGSTARGPVLATLLVTDVG